MNEAWENKTKRQEQVPEGAINLSDQEANDDLGAEITQALQDDLKNGNLESGKEKNKFREMSIEKAGFFLNDSVVDQYALGYVKNQKSESEKRKNSKYGKYKKQAEGFRANLSKRMEGAFESGELSSEAAQDEIKAFVQKVLKSEMRVTNLEKLVADFDYEEKDNVDVEDGKERLDENLKEVIEAPETEETLKKQREEITKEYPQNETFVSASNGTETTILKIGEDKVLISIHKPYAITEKEGERTVNFRGKKSKDIKREVGFDELKELLKYSFVDEEAEEDEQIETNEQKDKREKDAFWQEFEKYKGGDELNVFSFGYVSAEGKFLAKIQEGGERPYLITVEDLREKVGRLELKKSRERLARCGAQAKGEIKDLFGLSDEVFNSRHQEHDKNAVQLVAALGDLLACEDEFGKDSGECGKARWTYQESLDNFKENRPDSPKDKDKEKLNEAEQKVFDIYKKEIENIKLKAEKEFQAVGWIRRQNLVFPMAEGCAKDHLENKLPKIIEDKIDKLNLKDQMSSAKVLDKLGDAFFEKKWSWDDEK